jgi:hypothetical protein
MPIARLAGLEPVLDGPGELGLPGVMGGMPVDPGGPRLISRAWISLVFGSSIDHEQSTIMISAKLAGNAGPSAMEPADVTVTMALASRAPSGRYSFWKMSTVKSGALTMECSCGLPERG